MQKQLCIDRTMYVILPHQEEVVKQNLLAHPGAKETIVVTTLQKIARIELIGEMSPSMLLTGNPTLNDIRQELENGLLFLGLTREDLNHRIAIEKEYLKVLKALEKTCWNT